MGSLGQRIGIAARGALQVVLVAANSVMLARYHATGSLGTLTLCGAVGFLISFVWYANARQAARAAGPEARRWYACGAALGTMVGAWGALQLLG